HRSPCSTGRRWRKRSTCTSAASRRPSSPASTPPAPRTWSWPARSWARSGRSTPPCSRRGGSASALRGWRSISAVCSISRTGSTATGRSAASRRATSTSPSRRPTPCPRPRWRTRCGAPAATCWPTSSCSTCTGAPAWPTVTAAWRSASASRRPTTLSPTPRRPTSASAASTPSSRPPAPPSAERAQDGSRAAPALRSARSMIDRAKVSDALPEGTLEVGVGLVVAGITTYAYLTFAKAALGKSAYGPLGVLWAIIFTAGPGFFLPIEQEVSRALAARGARGEGGGPVLRRAATLGAILLVILVVVGVATGPLTVEHLFSGQWLLLVGLLLGLLGYLMGHLARGTVSGLGRFRPYAVYVGGEGVVRLAGCAVLGIIGVKTAGAYGVVLGAAPIVAPLVAVRKERDLVMPGPDAPYSELSASLGALLVASVLAQALVNAGVVAVKLLATGPKEDELVATFFVGVVVARLPLFLFQAVQAALLPRLTQLATSGRVDEFKRGFAK